MNSPISQRLSIGFGVAMLAMALIFGIVACGADDVSSGEAGSCEVATDCELGEVCNASGECIVTDCVHCEDDDDLICYQGSCSAPQCTTAGDCEGNEICDDGVCASGQSCSSSEECPDGQTCNPVSNTCVDDDNGGGDDDCTTAADCPGDDICEDGSCVEDEANGGECTLEASDCTGDTPYFDDAGCECVECLTGDNCGVTETCSPGGECVPEGDEDCPSGIVCDPGQAGTCGDPTPYCIDECCTECIGAGDCEGNETCVDGTCGIADGCDTDPSVCPSGYECVNDECQPPSGTQSCQDESDCADGYLCNPDTNECEPVGGEFGCGFCNDDCTCPGTMDCDGFFCVGCEIQFPLPSECPDDQMCWAAEDFDFGDENFCGPALW